MTTDMRTAGLLRLCAELKKETSGLLACMTTAMLLEADGDRRADMEAEAKRQLTEMKLQTRKAALEWKARMGKHHPCPPPEGRETAQQRGRAARPIDNQ